MRIERKADMIVYTRILMTAYLSLDILKPILYLETKFRITFED